MADTPEDRETVALPADAAGTSPTRDDSNPMARTDAGARFGPGTLVGGRFRIVSLLGAGGMGEVYRADDLRLGAPVALKFLPGEVASDPARLRKLHSEMRVGRQLAHPN